MENCIFCKIIQGEIPCEKIYENENFLAFLDINPVVKGHSVLIPKKHFENLLEINEKIGSKYVKSLQDVGNILIKKYSCDGFNVVLNNGKCAGQIVEHVHFHIIPRRKGDKIKVLE